MFVDCRIAKQLMSDWEVEYQLFYIINVESFGLEIIVLSPLATSMYPQFALFVEEQTSKQEGDWEVYVYMVPHGTALLLSACRIARRIQVTVVALQTSHVVAVRARLRASEAESESTPRNGGD